MHGPMGRIMQLLVLARGHLLQSRTVRVPKHPTAKKKKQTRRKARWVCHAAHPSMPVYDRVLIGRPWNLAKLESNLFAEIEARLTDDVEQR